jgi:hypothetical protein
MNFIECTLKINEHYYPWPTNSWQNISIITFEFCLIFAPLSHELLLFLSYLDLVTLDSSNFIKILNILVLSLSLCIFYPLNLDFLTPAFLWIEPLKKSRSCVQFLLQETFFTPLSRQSFLSYLSSLCSKFCKRNEDLQYIYAEI